MKEMKDLMARYKVSRDAINDWIKKDFPKPYKLDGNSSGWNLSEAANWEDGLNHAYY